MSKILDQTADVNGQQLYRLTKLYPLPPFVKSASSTDIYGEDSLETHQFADPASRQYPCHTAAATYISTLFFMDKKAELDPDRVLYIEGRLDDFAFVHGIGERIKNLKEKLAEAASLPTQIDDDDYALVLQASETPSGQKEAYYPVRNALEVKKAAEYLKDYQAEIPYRLRQRFAEKVLEKADKYGAGLGDLDDFLQKQAGHGAAASYEVAKLLFDRARLLKRAGKIEYAIKVGELARTVAESQGVKDQDQLVKLACLVDDVDRETGLSRMLLDLPAVEDVFFNLTVKKASQLRQAHLSTTSGNYYKLEDMDGLKLADVRSLMGEDFAEAVSTGGLFVSPEKVAEIVPTLPRNDAELFDRLLTSCGIHPVAKEAAYKADRMGNDDWKELAKMRAPVSAW